MHGNRRRWTGLLALIAMTCLAGMSARLTASTTESKSESAEEGPKVVAPPNRSVLLSGNLDVIYRGVDAPLEVDSRPVEWEAFFDAPIRVGHLHLSPGMHRVKIGDRKVELCVALNEMEHDGPSDWKIHRVHTMSAEKDRCAECHDADTKSSLMRVGEVLIPESCVACHLDGEVKDTHEQLIQPLKSCQTCHKLHGSPYPSLLKAPKAKILKEYAASK